MTKQTNVVVTYTVSAKGIEKANSIATPTVQATGKDHGLGKGWRAPNHTGANTRVAVLQAVLAAYPKKAFTVQQAAAAIKAAGVPTGLGTPHSYATAFTKNGYFAAVK